MKYNLLFFVGLVFLACNKSEDAFTIVGTYQYVSFKLSECELEDLNIEINYDEGGCYDEPNGPTTCPELIFRSDGTYESQVEVSAGGGAGPSEYGTYSYDLLTEQLTICYELDTTVCRDFIFTSSYIMEAIVINKLCDDYIQTIRLKKK